MRTYSFWQLFFMIHLLMVHASSQSLSSDLLPIFKNLTINEGLSNNEVKQIVQDKSGFIWLATGSGIDRYDGYSFHSFSPKIADSLGRERLTWRPLKLAIDVSERFFLASDFAGLQMYDPQINELVHFTSENSQLPDNTINSITLDAGGHLWIGTQKGLCKLNPLTRVINETELVSQSINNLVVDSNQILWLSLSNGGLARIEKGEIRLSKNLEKITIHDIHLINSDSLLLATESGALAYSVKSDDIKKLFDHQQGISFSSIYLDKQNNIWAGTYDFGLYYYSLRSQKTYRFMHQTGNQQSLISDHIACLSEDAQGNIWIGTYGDGVSIISSNLDQIKVRYNPVDNQAGGNSIAQILRTSMGEIWYHNNRTLTHISDSLEPYKQYQFSQNLHCNGRIQAIAEHPDGLLLATGCEILKWSPEKPDFFQTIMDKFPQIPGSQILSLNCQYPELFIGTSLSGPGEGLWIVNLENNTFQQFTDVGSPSSLVGSQVTTALRSSKDDLWIGTWDDLNLFRPTTSGFIGIETLIQHCDCLRGGSTVICVYEDHQGLVWFGRIDNGGLIVIDPENLSNNCFRIANGLPDNSVTSIVQDNENNIWIGTYRGAAKIKYPENPLIQKELDLEIIGTAEGLPNNTLWNSAISKNKDKIYFGTRDGLIEITTNEIDLNRPDPQAILSGFKILTNPSASENILSDGSKHLESITLRPADRVISIDFSAVDFYHSEATQYAYRMVNLDSNWIYLGNQHSITFANLAAGEYAFEVRARVTNSGWGPSEKLQLIFIPPFHQTWWFMTMIAIAALGLVYAIQQYRIQHLKRIQHIREEISRDLHDDIGSALTNIEIMSALAVRREQGPTVFSRILQTAQNSNEALHQIVWNMNPENDHLDSLLPYLANYAARSLEDFGIHLNIDDQTEGASTKIELGKRKDLYLAFKESLTNIHKHASAKTVNIQFIINQKTLEISIHDDGVGVQVEQVKEGNGIINMKKRMEKWNGSLSFASSSDKGMTVILRMPIP